MPDTMTAQEALYRLTEHLLGKDWYIVDPVGCEQANAIIVEEIQARYKAVNESKVAAYRSRHKKCKFCKHCVHVNPHGMCCQPYDKCKAKDKIIRSSEFPRVFCGLFELKYGGTEYADT